MTVMHNANQWDTSNVEFVMGQILDYSKTPTARMAHIDYGLSILSTRALENTPNETAFDLAELYRSLLRRRLLAGCEVKQRFYEIGSPVGLAETEAYLMARAVKEAR
jgi:hypothetical protein